MSFTSLVFYLGLAVAAIIFHLTPLRRRPLCLLLLSFTLYLIWSPWYFGLLLLSTGIIFLAGRALGKETSDRKRFLLLLLGLVPVVGILVLFKLGVVLSGILLPLGISYYTFKLIGYLLEVYWDKSQAQLSLIDFAAYSSFGPQLASGPIQRSQDFFAQLDRIRSERADFNRMESGFALILRGLLLKLLIGDRLASFIAVIQPAPENYTRAVLMITALCYLLQLYADFAGYTNIAIGIGKLFGIDSPPNFNAPFVASNMQDFWRRWHMSLTSWLTDYVFMPLRIATRDLGNAGLILSLMVNMILIGLWHGFTLPFLIFGILQGLFISASVLTLKERNRFFASRPWLRLPRKLAGMVITFLLMTFSMIFWRAHTVRAAVLFLEMLAGTHPAGALGFSDIRTDIAEPVLLCMVLAYYLGAGAPGLRFVSFPVIRYIPNWVIYGTGLLLLSALTTDAGSKFIYGQF